MKIAELFRSRQGEGMLTGQESVFIRTSGCNLRCWFCDTPYASWEPEGEEWSVDEIVARVEDYKCDHVVLTGGEPMIFAELTDLTRGIRRLGRHITIETAGTRYLPVECDLMSISPKLSTSAPRSADQARWRLVHERRRHIPTVIRRLVERFTYQVKFVIDTPADFNEMEHWLAEFPEIDRQRVMLMPQGVSPDELAAKAAWIEPYCQAYGLSFCPRRQIEWFGLVRGT